MAANNSLSDSTTFASVANLDTNIDVFSANDPVSKIRRLSVSSSGVEGNNLSEQPSISGNGRYTAFVSKASNLVPGDINGVEDIFVYDAKNRTTKQISLGKNGTQSNGASFEPSISSNGRFVTFSSDASNLVSSDTNNAKDIFVYDIEKGKISLASVNSNGIQGNGNSNRAFISNNGRYLTFTSIASNLVNNNPSPITNSVFFRDQKTGITTRIPLPLDGRGLAYSTSEGISDDGNFILYTNGTSPPSGLAQNLYLYNQQSGTSKQITNISNINSGLASNFISADGRYVAYSPIRTPGGGNFATLFLYDRQTNTTSTVAGGQNGNLSTSANILDVSISKDNRYLAFSAVASGISNTREIFIKDLQTGDTKTIPVDTNGNQSNGSSFSPIISANGGSIAFVSNASNLVPNDTNSVEDVFRAKNPFFS